MGLSTWRERCIAWQERDLEQALSYVTFVADVTTLAPDCRFVGNEAVLIARYDALPFPALAFYGDDPRQVTDMIHRLVEPHETFYCLVGEEQWPLVKAAICVLETHQEWQMLFRGHPARLDPGEVIPLGAADLPEMRALAEQEDMMAFERDPLSRGPWFGVRDDGALVAQGGVHLMLRDAAELGNIVTAHTHRRRGYASQVIAALVHTFHAQGKRTFLHVFKDNTAAVACYETLGFERLRTMYLAKCRARSPH
jgi:ribosomal protein S18 acetylase RimI-like enzyme